MVQSGGNTVIGASLNACLTTFEQAVKNFQSLDCKLRIFVNIARTTFSGFGLQLSSDRETAASQVALFLDRSSNPKFLQTLPVFQAARLSLRLSIFSYFLPPLLGIGMSEEFVDLSLYHTVFICRYLSQSIKTKLVAVFFELHPTLRNRAAAITISQQSDRVGLTIEIQVKILDLMCRLVDVIFDISHAEYEAAVSIKENAQMLSIRIDQSRSKLE